jgi:uncharacterized protein (DUF488 family)
MQAFYTIGHSTRTLAEFVELLRSAEASVVVDVRTVPRSRTNPQYNRESFPASLSGFDIGYRHIASLGGLRGSKHDVAPSVNGFWENKSFHNYADYAMGEAFHRGLAELTALGSEQRCAIMCAEAVWWRCHRRIIADYLLAAGEAVFHIMDPGKIDVAKMTEGASLSSGILTYPSIAPGLPLDGGRTNGL